MRTRSAPSPAITGTMRTLDVNERAVLPRPLRDRLDVFTVRRGLGVARRLLVQLRPGRDEVVGLPPDGLLGRIPEEPLGRGIPGDDLRVEVGDHDRRRADLEERLEVALLLLELGDVVVEDVLRDELAPDLDGPPHDVDVDERPVLPRPLGDGAHRATLARSRSISFPSSRRSASRHQVVDVPTHRLLGRVAEQPLGGRVPRRHDLVQVAW